MPEHTFRQGKCTKCGVTYFDLWSCNGDDMARLIEIKGLSDAVAGAKKGISDLKAAAGGLNASTGMLVAEINDLKDQVDQHRADLKFEAETLGNSPPNSEKQIVTSGDVGKVDAVLEKAVAEALEPEAPLNSDSAGAESGR